jgi:hypothetical protein
MACVSHEGRIRLRYARAIAALPIGRRYQRLVLPSQLRGELDAILPRTSSLCDEYCELEAQQIRLVRGHISDILLRRVYFPGLYDDLVDEVRPVAQSTVEHTSSY